MSTLVLHTFAGLDLEQSVGTELMPAGTWTTRVVGVYATSNHQNGTATLSSLNLLGMAADKDASEPWSKHTQRITHARGIRSRTRSIISNIHILI